MAKWLNYKLCPLRHTNHIYCMYLLHVFIVCIYYMYLLYVFIVCIIAKQLYEQMTEHSQIKAKPVPYNDLNRHVILICFIMRDVIRIR